MPKTSNLLRDIRETFNGFENINAVYSSLNDKDQKLREFLAIFEKLEDTRMTNKCTYSTMTIAGIVFLGLLHNMDTWIEISAFAKQKQEFIGKFVDLSKGIPSHDTLERVFSLINSETLEGALVDFIERSIEATAKILELDDNEMRLLAIDGKELKGSGRKYNTPEKIPNGQIMHFYDASTGVCIKSQLIDNKTNEIPTAQKILTALNIKGMIITSDAMNCQKKTVNVIAEGKAHYVLGLKGNHGDFYEEITDAFKGKNKYGAKAYLELEAEKNHNQVEKRRYYMINTKGMTFASGWKNLKNIVMYKKTITNVFTGEEKEERRYYITDLNDLELIGDSIRRHWSVENELHCHMDVNMHEDANKTVNKKAINNLSVMKKNVLTILKLIQPFFGNNSINVTRKLFACDYDTNVIKLFAFLDAYDLRKLLKSK